MSSSYNQQSQSKSKIFERARMKALKHQIDLWRKSLLTLLDFNPKEIQYLLDLSKYLKDAKAQGIEVSQLL